METLAGKVIIDHMKSYADPRLREKAYVSTGDSAKGVYTGVDQIGRQEHAKCTNS